MFDVMQIRNVFYHEGCPDGIAARELLKLVLPHISYHPFQFGTELALNDYRLDHALFIDCHPRADQIQQLFLTYRIFLADHHKTSEPICQTLVDLGFGDRIYRKGSDVSGAMLAYELIEAKYAETATQQQLDRAWRYAELTSIGDTWQTSHHNFKFARTLSNFIGNFKDGWRGVPDKRVYDMLPAYQRSLEMKVQKSAKSAIIRTIEGTSTKIAFVGSEPSDVAEVLRPQGINIIANIFATKNDNGEEVYVFSLRSDESFNVREFAQTFGGGGHDRAAGFSLPLKDFEFHDKNPMVYFVEQIHQYQLAASAL